MPAPCDKFHEFFATPSPKDFKNARHTQLRTQIRLFVGWDFENKKPMHVQTDAIWCLYFVEKLTKRLHNELSESIRLHEESSMTGKITNTMLRFQLPIEFFFFNEKQPAPTDFTDPRLPRIARRGCAALLKLMSDESGTIYGAIMSIGASFFEAKFNDANAPYPVQCSLRSLLKPQDFKWHVDNNYPPAYMHKSMREKWSKIDVRPLKRSQKGCAEQKWVEYFVLNLTRLQAHADMAHDQCTATESANFDSKYTPLRNTPLVEAAFENWPPTTLEALVAEASALN
jgi:hypothetical protein